MESLLPFYGLSIAELKKRNEESEKVIETYTLIVNDSKVVLQWNDDYARDTIWSTRQRADAQINLMEPFIDRLPAFRATFSDHDQPSVTVPFEELKALTEAANKKQSGWSVTRLTTAFNPPDSIDTNKPEYKKLCPPTSALAKGVIDKRGWRGSSLTPASPDTFVRNHLAAMNPCDHPSVSESKFPNPR